MLPTAAADGAVTNGVGGGVPRKHSGGALLPPAAAWGRRDSGVDGGSDGGGRDSYDGSSGSEDGGGGGGDAASVASSRAGLLAGEGEGHGEGGRPRNVWEAAQDQLTMGECVRGNGEGEEGAKRAGHRLMGRQQSYL